MSTDGGIPYGICAELGYMQNIKARQNIITFMHKILKENRDLHVKNKVLQEENMGNDVLLEHMQEQVDEAEKRVDDSMKKIDEYKKLVSDILARGREDQKQLKLLNSRINALKRKIAQKEAQIALSSYAEPDSDAKAKLSADDILNR